MQRDDDTLPPLDAAVQRLLAAAAKELEPYITAAVERAVARQQQPPQHTSDRRRTLTVKQAAEELSVHAKTVRRMVSDGRLRATRTGSGGSARVLVLRESLDELIGAGRA